MKYEEMTPEEIVIDRLSWCDNDIVIQHGRDPALSRENLYPREDKRRSLKVMSFVFAWQHWKDELIWVRPFLFEDKLIRSLDDFRDVLFWPIQPEILDTMRHEYVRSLLTTTSIERRK